MKDILRNKMWYELSDANHNKNSNGDNKNNNDHNENTLFNNSLFNSAKSFFNRLYLRTFIGASICLAGLNIPTNSVSTIGRLNPGVVIGEAYSGKSTITVNRNNKDTLKFGTVKYDSINNIGVESGAILSNKVNATSSNMPLSNISSSSIPSSNITPMNISPIDNLSLDSIIASCATFDNKIFVDNDYYRMMRENDAFAQIKKYDIKTESEVLIVNKTFQKAMIINLEMQPYIYSKDSIDSFVKQGRKFKVSRNMPENIVEMKLESKIYLEMDCSTAKVYGKKIYDGDAKTPEGIFTVYGVEDSHNWTFEGLWAYGPKFLRIKDAIGIHGNGTDESTHDTLVKDKRYVQECSLGIYSNNFGRGLSHGCIRLKNEILDKLIKDGMIKMGTKVIIFENKELTETLFKHYLSSNYLSSINKSFYK